ncbi:MAG: tryptophan-rich sensory protein [Candidatus Promineofilum sp.]|nr:tryptophan-rich sensory protein [Promineifilum sp.]MCW5862992.1 tryptophan-rich sensory protein [Anaerolineae bacterium]
MTKDNRSISIITLVFVIGATIAANVLAFTTNMDTGDIANSTFDSTNYFFPATYVFTTIWPVIYAAIVGWAIYQALPAHRDNPRFRTAAPWMIVNMVLNAVWVWVFGMQAFVATVVIIIPVLYTAVMVYRKLRVGEVRVGAWERAFQIGVTVYLAWLCVATVANVASALIAARWDGFGLSREVWGLIMLLVGTGLAFLLYRGFNREVVIPLVFIYAYVGIIARYADEPLILTGAILGAVALAGLSFFHFRGGGRARALQPA